MNALSKLLPRALLVAVSVAVFSSGALATSEFRPLQPWNTLALVYESTDVEEPDQVTAMVRQSTELMVQALTVAFSLKPEPTTWEPQMTAAAKANLNDALAQMPGIVDEWSDGRAAMDITVQYVDTPLSATAYYGHTGATVNADSIRTDLERYAPHDVYDAVFVVWRNASDQGPLMLRHAGVAFPYLDSGTNAYIASIPLKAYFDADTDTRGLREVFVHEWLHQVIAENNAHGAENVAPLHEPRDYGYENVGTARYWYSDMMNGNLADAFGVHLLDFTPPWR